LNNNENEKVGRLMQNRSSDNKVPYIFLGPVSGDHVLKEINPERKLGWFTPYPLQLQRGGFESEVPVFAWFVDLFEDMKVK
jgi:hypothetical protein